jgi:hypothetical protein
MLSILCSVFQAEVEALDPKDEDYGTRLRTLVLKLAKDATAHVADYGLGEVPALLQLCQQVLAWLKSESEDPEDRQHRYGRQQAVLDLLTFSHALAGFHGGSAALQRKNLAEHRTRIADALRPLVPM